MAKISELSDEMLEAMAAEGSPVIRRVAEEELRRRAGLRPEMPRGLSTAPSIPGAPPEPDFEKSRLQRQAARRGGRGPLIVGVLLILAGLADRRRR